MTRTADRDVDTPPERAEVFGPPERGGFLAGIGLGQIVGAAVGLYLAFRLFLVGIGTVVGLGLFVIVGGAWVALWLLPAPAFGRPAYQALWLYVKFRRAPGRWRNPAGGWDSATIDVTGEIRQVDVGDDVPFPGPPPLDDDLIVLEVPTGTYIDAEGVERERTAAVIRDGAHRYVAVVKLSPTQFSLRDEEQQDTLAAAWGDAIRTQARGRSPIRLIQWVESTVPDLGAPDLVAEYADHGDPDQADGPFGRAYRRKLGSAAPLNQRHRLHVALMLDDRYAEKAIRAAGGGELGACRLVLRAAEQFATDLARSGAVVLEGMLTPAGVWRYLRESFDPAWRIAATGQDADAVAPSWPRDVRTPAGHMEADTAVHASYEIVAWPRSLANVRFLAPLIAETHPQPSPVADRPPVWCRRVSMVFRPVPAAQTRKNLRARRTNRKADRALADRYEIDRDEAVDRLEQESLDRRSAMIAAGDVEVLYAGYITVTAPDLANLEDGCAEIGAAADRSDVEIRPTYMEQEAGFVATLPLCRPLATTLPERRPWQESLGL